MAYMKDKFETWMRSSTSIKDEPYSNETINNYISVLKNNVNKLNGINIEFVDLFNIDNIEVFNNIYNKIITANNYNEINNLNHRSFSSGLILYKKFLQTIENNSTVNNETKFRIWIKTNSGREYVKSTIDRYVKALEMAKERLDIIPSNSLLNIGDINQFNKEVKIIQESLKYDFVNKKYGNGDLSAAISLYNKFLINSKIIPGNKMMIFKDIVLHIKEYVVSKGFTYIDGIIENFYLSLKSKPFVILAGTSGTGKTRLVRLFAEAIGATVENGRYKLVPVRPDWSDSSDLFGHVDLNGNFIPGAIIDFVDKAGKDIKNPYFLCLDEMNLARVEYYLSDILSVMETRKLENGTVISDPLLSDNYYGKAKVDYGIIRLPENLYIVGTVNMDETTFPFSRKVLDRANTIEFSYVDLIPDFFKLLSDTEPIKVNNEFLKSDYLILQQCDDNDFIEGICSELQSINGLLKPANAHIGYRVRDEIAFYMLNNEKNSLIPRDEAMDNEIMQKILPRIQGSSLTVKTMLCELFKHCAGEYEGYQTDNNDISLKMSEKIDDAKYKRCAEKITFMVRRYEEDGFTSYWL